MQVAFVTAQTPPFDVAFNKLAAVVTGGAYCHCETAFDALDLGRLRDLSSVLNAGKALPTGMQRARDAVRAVVASFPPSTPDAHPVTLAFHALAGQPLGVRVLSRYAENPLFRPYDETWRVYRLRGAPARVEQASLIWSLCQVGKPYDTMGALTSPLHWGRAWSGAPDPEQWFCSSLCLRFLQHLNCCGELSLKGTTPNSLERALRQYIPSDGARVQDTTGGTFALRFDSGHWGLVESLVPFIARVELGLRHDPQRVPPATGAAASAHLYRATGSGTGRVGPTDAEDGGGPLLEHQTRSSRQFGRHTREQNSPDVGNRHGGAAQ